MNRRSLYLAITLFCLTIVSTVQAQVNTREIHGLKLWLKAIAVTD